MSFLSHTSLGLQVWQGISLFQIWCISCNERNKRFTKTGSQSPCMSTNGYVYYLKNDLDLQNLLGDECSKFGVNLIKLVALEHIGLTACCSALNKADIQMHWHTIIFYQSSKYTSYMALNCNKPITPWEVCYMPLLYATEIALISSFDLEQSISIRACSSVPAPCINNKRMHACVSCIIGSDSRGITANIWFAIHGQK